MPGIIQRIFGDGKDEPSPSEQVIQEQINPTTIASSPTQEDWYWGRFATDDEEDYY